MSVFGHPYSYLDENHPDDGHPDDERGERGPEGPAARRGAREPAEPTRAFGARNVRRASECRCRDGQCDENDDDDDDGDDHRLGRARTRRSRLGDKIRRFASSRGRGSDAPLQWLFVVLIAFSLAVMMVLTIQISSKINRIEASSTYGRGRGLPPPGY